jgi:RNA polymerase sigma-70 factor (ECF subfamily)
LPVTFAEIRPLLMQMPDESTSPDHTFEDLVRREEPRLRAYLARRVPPDAVDDALADVLLVAWRRREELPAQPLPWLIGVAAKTLSMRWRSESRRAALVDRVSRQPAPPQPTVEAEIRRREQQRALAAALGALSERDRELVLLRFWDDLRPRHIAYVLGIAPVTIRARLRRATVRLHRHYGDALGQQSAATDQTPVGDPPADSDPVPVAVT